MNISNGNSFGNGSSMNLGGGQSYGTQTAGGSQGGLANRLLAVITWRI